MIKRTRPIKPSKNSIWDCLRWIPGPAIKTCPEGIWRAKKATPIKRTAIRKVSKKRVKLNAQYSAHRIAYLARPENQFCVVAAKGLIRDASGNLWPHQRRTTTVHHKAGRTGELLLDESKWLALSFEGHCWVEQNRKLAMEFGFSLSRV